MATNKIFSDRQTLLSGKKTLYVCMSLDVEEEGLFSGNYPTRHVSLANIRLLPRLSFLSREFSFPVTLFCAYPVFKDDECREVLAFMREECGAEIGAHLHHWSTPPIQEECEFNSAPLVRNVPRGTLERKIANLLEAGREFMGTTITSFRMGRWDLRRDMLPILASHGVKVDSSICPLRSFKGGPNHFSAPNQPYWARLANGLSILEVPITQLPVWNPLAKFWRHVFADSQACLDRFHLFGAISANPVWHSLPVMRWTARTIARKSGLLNIFWHSSEIMPGASPNIPDQKTADAMLDKIRSFAAWLRDMFNIVPVTATQIGELPMAVSFPVLDKPPMGDW